MLSVFPNTISAISTAYCFIPKNTFSVFVVSDSTHPRVFFYWICPKNYKYLLKVIFTDVFAYIVFMLSIQCSEERLSSSHVISSYIRLHGAGMPTLMLFYFTSQFASSFCPLLFFTTFSSLCVLPHSMNPPTTNYTMPHILKNTTTITLHIYLFCPSKKWKEPPYLLRQTALFGCTWLKYTIHV